jgi:uncharacterized OB-fold protein
MSEVQAKYQPSKPKVPAIEGWFRTEPEPHLVGSQCTKCRSYFFPRETFFCKNPACDGTEFAEVAFSRSGTLWSFTNGCYQPPAPYVSPDPFEPYVLAAVELAKEKIVILGQVVRGIAIADLKVGMPMELVIDTLYEDDAHEYTVWKWRPRHA